MSLFDAALLARTESLLRGAKAKQWRIACAESCTGGLVAGLLTEISGASDVIGRSFVTYSNRAKHELLGVEQALLEKHGAVSEAVACAMAQGVLDHTNAQLTLAVSGIAGPDGGTDSKPVGTVHMATATAQGVVHIKQSFGSIGRHEIRMASVAAGIDMLAARLND